MTDTQNQDIIKPADREEPAPEGFSIIGVRRAGQTTFSLYEGRTLVAENLDSPKEARKLADAFKAYDLSQTPVETVSAELELKLPVTPVLNTLRTNIYQPVPSAAEGAVIKLIRQLTDETLSQLRNSLPDITYTATDPGNGDISVCATAAPNISAEKLEACYAQVMSDVLIYGQPLTPAEQNALRVLEETSMDPMIRDLLLKLIHRLRQYT